MAGMFGGTMSSKSCNINSFKAEPFDGTNLLCLQGNFAPINESGFHDVQIAGDTQ